MEGAVGVGGGLGAGLGLADEGEAVDDGEHAEHGEDGAYIVERLGVALADAVGREDEDAEEYSDDTDGKVDDEYGLPVEVDGEPAADGGAEGGGEKDGDADDGAGAGALAWRECAEGDGL